jgi:Domain of Unknown Function (DUF1080).
MKKSILISVLCLAAAFTGYAQKSASLSMNDMMKNDMAKVQKSATKNATWPTGVQILEKDLTAGKTAQGAWKIENGELVSVKENQPIFIKKTKPQVFLAFEFTCNEDDEGYVFVRAPNGKVENAVKIKLAGKNHEKNDKSIGSINDEVWCLRRKMAEPKGERWVRMFVSVEDGSVRLGDMHNTSADYANRNLNAAEFAKIAEKTKLDIPADGDIGFVSTKGNLKFRKIYLNQF